MKKYLFSAMLVTAFFFYNETKAQVRFNINLNIGARPDWGLEGNYSGDYYYLPEIDSYYDIPSRRFIYFDGRSWTYASELPYIYRDYDLYRGYKVIVNEPRPYLHCDFYRDRYRPYYNTYRAPVVIAPRNQYGYDNNRYNRERWDDHDNGRRGYERNDRDRDDRNNRGRDHDDDRNRGRRGRG